MNPGAVPGNAAHAAFAVNNTIQESRCRTTSQSERIEIELLGERTATDRDQCEVRKWQRQLYTILEIVKLCGVDPRAYLQLVVESAPGGETYALPHECTGAIAKGARQNICEAGE